MFFESFSSENGQGLEKPKAGKTPTEYWFDASPYSVILFFSCLHLPAVLLGVCSSAVPWLWGDGFCGVLVLPILHKIQNWSNIETWHFFMPSYSSWCQPRWALSWKPKQLGGVLKVRESTNDIASNQGESYLDIPWSFKWYLIKNQTKLPAVVRLLHCGTSANQLLYLSRMGSVCLGVVQCKALFIPFSLLALWLVKGCISCTQH